MRKAQASTEYLIILAVVIIVALIVVGVMGWFPGIGSDVTISQSKQYWTGLASPFSIQDAKISGTTADLVVKNMVNDELNLTDLDLDGAGDITATNFASGAQKTVQVTNIGGSSCSSGDTFSYNITFTYDNTDTGLTGLSQIGERDLVGKCA
jgi:hypothetical protein